mmetsp:Transcript_11478/g.24219  ORF Transcript_11478/g.24219 Transcript_11478/m.24219 type:complete len:119 (+) Transcript_11478:181-537(+)
MPWCRASVGNPRKNCSTVTTIASMPQKPSENHQGNTSTSGSPHDTPLHAGTPPKILLWQEVREEGDSETGKKVPPTGAGFLLAFEPFLLRCRPSQDSNKHATGSHGERRRSIRARRAT